MLTMFPDGEQWSVGLKGTYDAFGFGLTYAKLNSDTTDVGRVRCRQPPGRRLLRLGQLRGRPRLRQDPERERRARGLDGDDSYELSAQYDLGGGATVNGGVRRTYNIVGIGDDEGGDSAWIGDFGISMAF